MSDNIISHHPNHPAAYRAQSSNEQISLTASTGSTTKIEWLNSSNKSPLGLREYEGNEVQLKKEIIQLPKELSSIWESPENADDDTFDLITSYAEQSIEENKVVIQLLLRIATSSKTNSEIRANAAWELLNTFKDKTLGEQAYTAIATDTQIPYALRNNAAKALNSKKIGNSIAAAKAYSAIALDSSLSPANREKAAKTVLRISHSEAIACYLTILKDPNMDLGICTSLAKELLQTLPQEKGNDLVLGSLMPSNILLKIANDLKGTHLSSAVESALLAILESPTDLVDYKIDAAIVLRSTSYKENAEKFLTEVAEDPKRYARYSIRAALFLKDKEVCQRILMTVVKNEGISKEVRLDAADRLLSYSTSAQWHQEIIATSNISANESIQIANQFYSATNNKEETGKLLRSITCDPDSKLKVYQELVKLNITTDRDKGSIIGIAINRNEIVQLRLRAMVVVASRQV